MEFLNNPYVILGIVALLCVQFFLLYKVATLRERDVWLDNANTDLTKKDFVTVGKNNYVVLTEDQYTKALRIQVSDF